MKGRVPDFRLGGRADVPAMVRLLADDDLGNQRERFESPLPETCYTAFEQIDRDPNHELMVAELNREVIGICTSCFLPPKLSGRMRAQIEFLRIDRNYRSRGLGR